MANGIPGMGIGPQPAQQNRDMFGDIAMTLGPALMAYGFDMPALAALGPSMMAQRERGRARREQEARRQAWDQALQQGGALGDLSEGQRALLSLVGPGSGASAAAQWLTPKEPKPTELSPGKAWGALTDLSTKPVETWTDKDRALWTGAYGVVNQPKMSLQPDPATGTMMPVFTQPEIPFAAEPWKAMEPTDNGAPPVSPTIAPPAPTSASQPAQQPRLTPQQAKEAQNTQATYDAAVAELSGYDEFLNRMEKGGGGYVSRGADYAEAQQWKAALLRVLGDMQAAGTIQEGEAERLMRSLVDISDLGVGSVLRYGTDPIPEAKRALEVLRGRLDQSYKAKMKTYTTPGTPTYQPPPLREEAPPASPNSGETSTGLKWSVD